MYSLDEYISKAKKIVEEHDLQKYVDMLLDFWEKHPTTLGHGFEHVLRTAVQGYEIAELNDYPDPEHLFIGGLFHDVHRPAEGEDGEEDQYLSLKISIDLFYNSKIPSEIATKVLHAIESHDNWRGKQDAPQYDVLLSMADKASHSELIAYSYIWSSNKYQIEKIGKPVYTSHLQGLYAFGKYQIRAWEVMMKHPVNGVERAIDSYIRIYRTISDNYEQDPTGKEFMSYLENVSSECRAEEQQCLQAFGREESSIAKIMHRFN